MAATVVGKSTLITYFLMSRYETPRRIHRKHDPDCPLAQAAQPHLKLLDVARKWKAMQAQKVRFVLSARLDHRTLNGFELQYQFLSVCQ